MFKIKHTILRCGSGIGAIALALMAFGAQAGGVFTNLYSFQNSTIGSNCLAGLAQGGDGNFYGAAELGGASNFGALFKMNPSGTVTNLYSFPGGSGGAYPLAALTLGNDGNLYGTTWGGTNNFGSVFKIGANGGFTNLYFFTAVTNGANPHAGLVQANDGNFYGTTYLGGTNGGGTVFKINTNGMLTNLYSFASSGVLGSYSQAGLAQGSDSNLYGTTSYGGTNNMGTVFKLSLNGKLASLYSFTGTTDGANPVAGLVFASDGYMYGTTEFGGTNGNGTIFSIGLNGGLTSLYSFTGAADGAFPCAGLAQGSDGNLYGTTESGGANGDGGVFKINTNRVLTSLYSFPGGSQGGISFAGLIQASDGKFYGTTRGGLGVTGTIFRMTIAPAFEAITLDGGIVYLTWCAEMGGTYQLQYKGDLGWISWTNLGSATVATGPTMNATDSITNGPHRFYRVVEQ